MNLIHVPRTRKAAPSYFAHNARRPAAAEQRSLDHMAAIIRESLRDRQAQVRP